MKRLLLSLAVLTTALPAFADFGRYQSHRADTSTLVVQSDRGEVRITAIDDAAFEIHYIEPGVKQLPSFARAEAAPLHEANLDETGEHLYFSVPGLTAVIDKTSVRLRFIRNGRLLVSEEHGYFAYDTARGFRFALQDDEIILGGGSRVLGMDRRGHRLPLYNKAHYGYTTESEQMYYSLPAVMSSNHYMVVFDNSASGWLDIGKTESDVLSFEAVGGRTSYIVVAGQDYPSLIENYTDVTGRQPMPPRWALGSFASRFGYRNEAEARDVVARYRDLQIPLDAIVLDIYWFGKDIKGHMGNLDWDRDAWPTPEAMMADFRADGVRTVPITEPFILTTSKTWDDAVANEALATTPTGEPRRFDFYFGNTGLVDMFDDQAADWFWSFNERLFEQGAAGTWGDLGEPEVHPGDALHWLSQPGVLATADEIHNAYGHEWARRIFEKQIKRWPERRPMIMMRSGFAGSQRYGMIPWSGDVSREWGGLKPQVELSLQMGLFGLAYMHSDLGGFAGGERFDRELYLRWLQYGVFQPVFRPHAQDHIAPEPVFHDRRTRDVARRFINLRYQLLPYNYTLAWENSTTGLPLMRPLAFADEDNRELLLTKDSYFWGDAFLVHPITDPKRREQTVTLPEGVWFDFWDGSRHAGGTTLKQSVSLQTIPVFVRAGAIVPMTPVVQTTDDYSSESLTLHYYADASVDESQGRIYEDDGLSRSSIEDGHFELLEFNAARDGDYLAFELTRSGAGYDGMPEIRDITLSIHNWPESAPRVRAGSLDVATQEDDGVLSIRFSWDGTPLTVEVGTPPPALKPVVYQVFTRLFGNKVNTNKPWGTIEENGVGKFADFNDAALRGIRDLGTTHIWYTGVPHHAVIRDYSALGIGEDDPDVVKGRAGSPYAIRDYYSVNPDLAENPADRLQEFRALIERTHDHGMQVVIDIVPNHIARAYQSQGKPAGIRDFGADDDTSVEWARDNDFYYVMGESFSVPEGYVPLGGEKHPLADGAFAESPAKWTGNGARAAQPKVDDWFETVKINFGVRPDGSYAFDRLPPGAAEWSNEEMVAFWAEREVPGAWKKFRDIVHFWLDQGVDGFRYDMAQMVPVEFWSYLNASIKARKPDALLLSEIYVPDMYRDYVALGRMDYLYDKVGFYDTLRRIMRGEQAADDLAATHAEVLDIEQHMLHFLENHDEQRIASPDFAGDASAGIPGMVVSALIGRAPTMLYFGQEVGEPGAGDAGFGKATRTTIFDYWGVPAHQRWMNDGAFDGGQLSDDESALRAQYAQLLNISRDHPAMLGNYTHLPSDPDSVFAFARGDGADALLVVSNFSATEAHTFTLDIPASVIANWSLDNGRRALHDLLGNGIEHEIAVDHGQGRVRVSIEPQQSLVFSIGDARFKSLHEQAFLNDPQGAGVIGERVFWRDVGSAYLTEQRHIVVWLPPGYDDDPERRYPVIYMSDGENLFDPRIASWGVDWGIDEAITNGAQAGDFEAAIVVGTWSTAKRGLEYSPWHEAPEYAKFLEHELMPRVNAAFRTRTGPQNTFAMGASMGGLLSYYLVSQHPDLFGACGCVSSHFRLSPRDFGGVDETPYVVSDIKAAATLPGGRRFLFDYGTESLDATYEVDHEPVAEWFRQQGLIENQDYGFLKFDGADHSERAWRARVDHQLKWLLGD